MDLYFNVLKLFLKHETWQKFNQYIDLEFLRKNYPEVFKLFIVLGRLHEKKSETTYTEVDVEAALYTDYPQADRAIFGPLLGRLKEISSSNSSNTIENYLSSLQERGEAAKLAFAGLDYADGKITNSALRDQCEAFVKLRPIEQLDPAVEFVTDDLETLYQRVTVEGGLNWRLKSLNRALGPLRKSNFGFIFARPETGKTTFLASELSHMVGQSKDPAIWFNNEQGGDEVKIRLYESVLGASWKDIQANRTKAQEAYDYKGGRRILLKDDATINRQDVERLLSQQPASVIVFDQLDKVRGFDSERDDLRLGTIYQWARELSKSYGPVIGVSQADGSAEGIKWLNMGHVANAKTAKQAEADWILGIGLSYDDPPNVRGFSICKNKLLGGELSVSNMRHGKWEVLLEPEIARYKDVAHD